MWRRAYLQRKRLRSSSALPRCSENGEGMGRGERSEWEVLLWLEAIFAGEGLTVVSSSPPRPLPHPQVYTHSNEGH